MSRTITPLTLLLPLACAGANVVSADGASAMSTPRDAGRPELPPVSGGARPDAGAAPVTDAATTAEEACSAFASAQCARWNECAPFYLRLWFGDVSSCALRMRQLCDLQLAAPGTVETAALRSSCARELGTRSCADWLALDLPASCLPSPGPLPDGDACASAWQCHSTYCAAAAGCGVCAPRSRLGGTCSEDAGCREGLVCDQSTGTCAAPALLGESCGGGQPCQAGAYCNLGICAALQSQNAGCTQLSCNDLEGLYCSDVGAVCRAARLAVAGDACGWIDAVTWATCTGKSYCLLPSSTAIVGTCAVAAGDGQSCDTQNGPLCAPPAICHDGRCRFPSACD